MKPFSPFFIVKLQFKYYIVNIFENIIVFIFSDNVILIALRKQNYPPQNNFSFS